MNPKIKKTFSLTLIISGLILILITLLICTQSQDTVPGFLGSLIAIRGVLFLCSLTLLVVGIYLYPTVRHGTIINILFLLPVISAFVMTVIIPFFLGVYYSLTDWTGVGMSQFVGFANYKGFINTPEYIHSFFATSAFTIINVLLVNLIAFALALLVTTKIKGRNFYRAGFFVPNLIGGIVLGYIWQFIFTGIASKLSLDVLSTSFLVKPNLAILALVIVSTWQYAGYIMMIYVTAIQSIPASIMEASKMDGALGYAQLTKIIIPMVANSFTICIFLTLVNSFKLFDLNYAITNGGPSKLFMNQAINSTELLALNIYKTAFTRNNMAIAQAKAVIFFILLSIISLIQVYISKKKEVEM